MGEGKSQEVSYLGKESPMQRGLQVPRPLCLKNRNGAGMAGEDMGEGALIGEEVEEVLARLYGVGFYSDRHGKPLADFEQSDGHSVKNRWMVGRAGAARLPGETAWWPGPCADRGGGEEVAGF